MVAHYLNQEIDPAGSTALVIGAVLLVVPLLGWGMFLWFAVGLLRRWIAEPKIVEVNGKTILKMSTAEAGRMIREGRIRKADEPLPPHERVYISETPKELVARIAGCTTLEAEPIIGAYRGKSMAVTGTFLDVSQATRNQLEVIIRLENLPPGGFFVVRLYFAKGWESQLRELKPEKDELYVLGEIAHFDAAGLILNNCERVPMIPEKRERRDGGPP